MYKIQTLNKISEKGLSLLPAESYSVSDDGVNPDGRMTERIFFSKN